MTPSLFDSLSRPVLHAARSDLRSGVRLAARVLFITVVVWQLATGQAASFTTPAEFWDFIDEVLTELTRTERARSQEAPS